MRQSADYLDTLSTSQGGGEGYLDEVPGWPVNLPGWSLGQGIHTSYYKVSMKFSTMSCWDTPVTALDSKGGRCLRWNVQGRTVEGCRFWPINSLLWNSINVNVKGARMLSGTDCDQSTYYRDSLWSSHGGFAAVFVERLKLLHRYIGMYAIHYKLCIVYYTLYTIHCKPCQTVKMGKAGNELCAGEVLKDARWSLTISMLSRIFPASSACSRVIWEKTPDTLKPVYSLSLLHLCPTTCHTGSAPFQGKMTKIEPLERRVMRNLRLFQGSWGRLWRSENMPTLWAFQS